MQRSHLFILKLITNCWASCRSVQANDLIKSMIYLQPEYFEKTRKLDYLSP